MSRPKVVVVNTGYESYEVERRILAPLEVELVVTERDCRSEDEVLAVAGGAQAILVREAPITARVIQTLDRLKVIARYGVGVDNVDLEAARQKGVYVANVPGYGTEEVSDHAAALILACLRRLVIRDRRLRAGWFETGLKDRIFRTAGKVLGLVGYGLIGRALYRKWRGFQPGRVLVHDPFAEDRIIRADGAVRADLDTLLVESDYVSLHAPLTPETHHMINERTLRLMKKTAILINTSRGGLIEEKALITALQDGWIAAAGLDVFEREPLPPHHPLLGLENVVLTPHAAWYSKDAELELQTRASQEVFRVLSGGRPECWVNPW
ncbi:MAG: C-terminal binding protein [Thermodesulfobacteriota bacterium]